MPEFLLEVGCEELPASFVEKAYRDLADLLDREFATLGIKNSEPTFCGTPRRLIVGFKDLLDRQPDTTKEQRGPSLQAAFDATGEPTKALLGFCKSQGVEVGDLRKDEQYVWANKFIPGLQTAELIALVVPKIILSLQFEKSMRWGSSRTKFARPIRWILCAFDHKRVEFNVEGVRSGLISTGHRFYAPDIFESRTYQEHLKQLRLRFVEPESQPRKQMILDGIAKATVHHAEVNEDLLDENTFLCEWPVVIAGSFAEGYLNLPEPVLVTAMAKHERMFPVRDSRGKLINEFLFVRNSGEDDTVRKGCAWVLGARFNDARFFYEQDEKVSFDQFLDRTQDVLFQAKLGTVRQRADRLSKLAGQVAEMTGANSVEFESACSAGLYAKADLATGLVSELSSLQGVIGGEYARRAGLCESVCVAIAHQYHLKELEASTVEGRTAIRLVVADQIDKLAGYLGLGMEPSGSSDPFGLRRSVTILIDCARRWNGFFPAFDQIMESALANYAAQGFELQQASVYAALSDIFLGRYPVLFDARRDVLDAAMLSEMRWELMMPRNVQFRIGVLEELAGNPKFVQTATRPMNIVASAKQKGIEYAWEDPLGKIVPEKLGSVEGIQLYQVLKEQEDTLFKAVRDENSSLVSKLVQVLEAPLNRFFDQTMIMSENLDERFQRLTLAHAASLQLLCAGDFTKLQSN
jgi:glycyl-tRNA synthetase beta chain